VSEALRLLIYRLDTDRREAHEDREIHDPDAWNPYLGTRATSEQRSDRAERLRLASRKREDAA
jgi:hypothetical protein